MISGHSPVIVFGYNRPNHLRETLRALSCADFADESKLWIFCDGPKPGHNQTSVLDVRIVADDPEWQQRFASVTVVAADANKGLARSIIEGVSRVLEQAGSVIVIEDDLIVAPDFLRFMNDCLVFYRFDSKIGTVTGFCPLRTLPPVYSQDVFAVPRNCSYGWGIWKDRWVEVDWEARDARRLWTEPVLRRSFTSAGPEQVHRLQRQLQGAIDSWSIRVDLWLALTGRYTIYPTHNRIKNIGFDGSGVHCASGGSINDVISTTSRPYVLTRPSPDPVVLREFRKLYGGSWPRRLLRSLRDRSLVPTGL